MLLVMEQYNSLAKQAIVYKYWVFTFKKETVLTLTLHAEWEISAAHQLGVLYV